MKTVALTTVIFAALALLVLAPSEGASYKVTISTPPYSVERSASGNLDTDHAYKKWLSPNLTYYGCEATVDQYIDLGLGDAPRTYWIGTARKHTTNTLNWRIPDPDNPENEPKTLAQAALDGWIDDDLAWFNNESGQEVPFKAWQAQDIEAWRGVKIEVLTSGPHFRLIIPRKEPE